METTQNSLKKSAIIADMQIGQPLSPISMFIVRSESFSPTEFGTINMPSTYDVTEQIVEGHFDRFNDVFVALSDA